MISEYLASSHPRADCHVFIQDANPKNKEGFSHTEAAN